MIGMKARWFDHADGDDDGDASGGWVGDVKSV